VDGPSPTYPVLGIVGDDRSVTIWTETGLYSWDSKRQTPLDLIPLKPRVQCEVWVYRRPDGKLYSTGTEKGHSAFEAELVARIPIDVEEGTGLGGGESSEAIVRRMRDEWPDRQGERP
jgi:hypothetical protein